MNKRGELHEKLQSLIGNQNVYFQPPTSVQLTYPCVIYNLDTGNVRRADNSVYTYTNSYEVTFIYKKANIDILSEVLRSFEMCSVSRVYVVDNLYHYVFEIFY